MDGVQRNFSMMAEKIDRMRCLRERCDNYVRLIKLTLDETIKEQNSLLDGSAIHNRLKYLGVMDKPKSLSNTFNTDKYHKNIDFNNKYKYLVFDDDLVFRQHKKKSNLNTNDMYLSNDYSSYNTNYKPRVHDFSTVYDDQHNTYYMPINSKKYGKTTNFRTPDTQEYQVYYFPTSKPIAQYPRQTTERFYRRKPIKQYPKEEVPYWPTRYPKPVRVIEREPSYSMIDYGYRSTNDYRIGKSNIQPYTPEHRSRYYPTNDNNIYHGHDDSDYYYEPHLGQRSFSSITRPCSPVYHRDILCDRTQIENSSSLLEKKIRDYVWNPHKERIEKYTIPSYEKSTYYTDFKPLNIKHQGDETFRTRSPLGLDYRARNRKNEVTKESEYKKNSILTTSPERRPADDEYIQPHKDNDHYSESTIYKKKTETPSTFSKRISFDLGNEHIDPPNHTNLIEENTNENYNTKNKLVLGRKESNAKLDDNRRTSLLAKDDYSVSISKQKISPSHTNVSSRRQSLIKQEKLASIGNSLESDNYINLKNNFQGNDSGLSEKNVHSYNNDRINYDNNNDIQIYPKTQDDKNNVMLKDISNENTYRDLRRDSNENNKKKLIETTEKTNFGYQDHTENTMNINDNSNITKRRESYKGEQKLKKENTHGSTTSSNGMDNKLENEYNNKNGTNVSSKNRISSPIVDHRNGNSNMNEYETDNQQQFINKSDSVEKQNNSETIQPHNVVNDSTNEIDIISKVTQVSSDLKTIPKDQEPLHDISNNDLTNNTNYYQDHPDEDDTKELPAHEYETQPEHVASDEHFYTDELVDGNKEVVINNNIEPIQQDEFDDKNNVHDEYYYQNPTDDKKENLTENQYENPDSQVKDVEKQHANDDYYYENYSNVDQQEQPENQYSKPAVEGEYTGEHVEHDDYYYQNHAGDEIKEQQGDQQYVDPNYQGNYVDQPPAHDDYYYQDYSNGDPKTQPENQYTESDHQGEYVAEQNNMVHDDYYYQNHPNEGKNENQVDQHYQEHQENYVNGEQDNYYYENNSNVNTERHPEDQYDENAQQETYTGDQHTNDGYYYQEGNTNYDETVPKEQYDGYVDNNQDANAAYYTDPNVENYDQQQHDYENNSYPTQKSEYIEPYEQNSNNENNGYSENIDESQPTSQIANEQK
ncbi:unnamed protein product [Macrosiphum euphorbiae]|uniref:Uncharacterized protein n=1 Tax=Macrosiphum euphorbiae TaxID=13131 RepID=A0AAV0WAM6_9HEMI|nr:unnamed protein product [Macrosiphum euphorbiae]